MTIEDMIPEGWSFLELYDARESVDETPSYVAALYKPRSYGMQKGYGSSPTEALKEVCKIAREINIKEMK